jgi:DNA primase
VPGAKITLREAQAIAYLLEHGRWPDAETATWMEERTSRVALDYLLATRLRGVIAAAEEKGQR